MNTQNSDFKFLLEQFDDVKIMRYQVPGFEQLSLKQKKLIYFLTQATLSGRDITFDQHFKYNLLIRKVLENIYTNYTEQNMNLVSEINAYITGSLDTGLLVISGKTTKKDTFPKIEKEINKIIDGIRTNEIHEDELTKVKNKFETSKVFSDIGVQNKAMNLGYFELLKDINLINTELSQYENVSSKDIMNFCKTNMIDKKCSKLYIHAKN